MDQERDNEGFLAELIRQIKAGDPYGRRDGLSEEALLRPFILTPEDRKALPLIADLDPAVEERIRTFYRAVAAEIENKTGVMVGCVLELDREGFGRVMVYTGHLILSARTLRDAHRFGFASREKLAEAGGGLVEAGTEILRRFPQVAGF